MVILDYDLLKDNGKFSKPMISSETMANILYEKCKKDAFKKDLSRIFLKNSLVQINSKLNSKPYDYPY